MPEWWTYSVSDFLMFSPRAYYRMVERYNAAAWPGHLAALAAGAALLLLTRRPERPGSSLALLAAAWATVAWAFFWERYAGITLAGRYFAGLFLVEAVLFAAAALPTRSGARAAPEARFGGSLLVLGVGVYPALAPLFGRGWDAAELFGLMPEPTAIATLGALLLVDVPFRSVLLTIPFLWCAVGGLTLYAMGSPEAWACALAPALVGAAHLARRRPAG